MVFVTKSCAICRFHVVDPSFIVKIMVRVVGLEPTTPWSQTMCANQLRYTRILIHTIIQQT